MSEAATTVDGPATCARRTAYLRFLSVFGCCVPSYAATSGGALSSNGHQIEGYAMYVAVGQVTAGS